MEVRLQTQVNPIAEEVSALIAAIRPILEALLYGLKADVVAEVGGYAGVKFKMLPRLYRSSDGDIGMCFEYAVHNALRTGNAAVSERAADALRLCNIPGTALTSLLFAVEKSGKLDLVDSVRQALTDDSRLLYGTRGRPLKLKRHIDLVASAFHRPNARLALPQSIRGLWKADLFLGNSDEDGWVGTSVKVNDADLRADKGLRIGIVPTRQGRSDRVRRDEHKNLIVCPLPYDGSFGQLFYTGLRIVQQVLGADANLPDEDALPLPLEREVARNLAMRRESTVLRLIEVLRVQAQPGLIMSTESLVPISTEREGKATERIAESILAPIPKAAN